MMILCKPILLSTGKT